MQLDPLTALAFAMHSSPKAYAVLIGSGVSSAAGIPTGWAIVVELIRRVAATQGADAGERPDEWYRSRFGEDATYSTLLEKLGRTPAERQGLLRGFIEPDHEQRLAGLRIPTAAHHALARLVAAGYVRVILTTNFDRLIEQALEHAGVPVDVIDDADALAGARPLSQSRCVLVTVHGDYRDARILNTPEELAKYDRKLDAFLDRILDEHGLLVSGWSATWDPALRAAIVRQPTRRFTTFWASRGELTPEAQALVTQRNAELIPSQDAETLFTKLESKVTALADLDRPHPLTVATAIAELKRYLPDPQARIRLEELLSDEVERVMSATTDADFPPQAPGTTEEARRRVNRYQAVVEIMLGLFATGGHYSRGAEQAALWSHALERLANHEGSQAGLTAYLALRRYPALLCLYAGGIASVAAENWSVLHALLVEGHYREDSYAKPAPLVAALHPWRPFENVDAEAVLYPGRHGGRLKTPISDHLHSTLRPVLSPVIPSDSRYTEMFDRLEYLIGLVLADLSLHPVTDAYMMRTHIGSFGWRYGSGRSGAPWNWVKEHVKSRGVDWPLLKVGFFDGEPTRVDAAIAVVDEGLSRRNWDW